MLDAKPPNDAKLLGSSFAVPVFFAAALLPKQSLPSFLLFDGASSELLDCVKSYNVVATAVVTADFAAGDDFFGVAILLETSFFTVGLETTLRRFNGDSKFSSSSLVVPPALLLRFTDADFGGDEAGVDSERFLTENPKRVKSILGDTPLIFFFFFLPLDDGVFMIGMFGNDLLSVSIML